MGDQVKLHGAWASPFNSRVVWALKYKGIPYEYIEENLPHKSPQLLQYNHVHKKIPVLVHGGNPICESIIILEYIDEIWPQNPLLPLDPYERAQVRFWVNFVDEKASACLKIWRSSGEEQENGIKGCLEFMDVMEEQCLGDKKFLGGDSINILDIAFGTVIHWLGVIEDIIEVKMLGADKFPRLCSWFNNFKDVPAIRENLPNREKMVVLFKNIRELLPLTSSHQNKS